MAFIGSTIVLMIAFTITFIKLYAKKILIKQLIECKEEQDKYIREIEESNKNKSIIIRDLERFLPM